MRELQINLSSIGYPFASKPLLVGGKAMEYYGLRQAGGDIDFVVSAVDHSALVQRYPGNIKEIHGDIGVCVGVFEIWNRICLFDYDFLAEGAIDHGEIRIIHLHRLLFMKTLAIGQKKCRHDVDLLVREILQRQYKTRQCTRDRQVAGEG